MEIKEHIFTKDITVFCKKADSFPLGVRSAFEFMHKLVEYDAKRLQFAITQPKANAEMDYWAANVELNEGEFENNDLEIKSIPKGIYKYVSVKGYMKNTSSFWVAFKHLIDTYPHINDPIGIEWYKNMEEAWCMVKVN
jgi:hypothetical protein